MKIRYLDGLWYFCITLEFWMVYLVFLINNPFHNMGLRLLNAV